jgi:hypothetical protein
MSLIETLPTPETNTWCESGTVGDGGSSPGDIDPSGGDVAHGWPDSDTPPARQRFNWLDGLLHRVSRYLRQRGIAGYHADETYPPNARIVAPSGDCYKQIHTDNVNGIAPGSDATKWKKWGHTDDEVTALATTAAGTVADEKIGTLSGSLADGTISVVGNTATVAYCRRQNFPGTKDANVCCRLSFPVGGGSVGGANCTLSLSGAAAFETGADGASLTLASTGGTYSSGAPIIIAKVTGEQTVQIATSLLDTAVTNDFEVVIRGH